METSCPKCGKMINTTDSYCRHCGSGKNEKKGCALPPTATINGKTILIPVGSCGHAFIGPKCPMCGTSF